MEQRSIDISNSFNLYYTSRAVYSFILFSWSRIISFSSPIFLFLKSATIIQYTIKGRFMSR